MFCKDKAKKCENGKAEILTLGLNLSLNLV